MKLTKSKLKEIVKEVINEGEETANSLIKKMKKISDFKKYWADSDNYDDPAYENVPVKLFKKHFGLNPQTLQSIDHENINVMRVGKVDLYNESINEGNPTPAVQKKLIKIFQNDPLYKDVIMATNSKDFKKAIDTLRSIRGPNAIKLLKKHSKKLMGKNY